jgi:hypothetical protein
MPVGLQSAGGDQATTAGTLPTTTRHALSESRGPKARDSWPLRASSKRCSWRLAFAESVLYHASVSARLDGSHSSNGAAEELGRWTTFSPLPSGAFVGRLAMRLDS